MKSVGEPLLRLYNNSVLRMVRDIFPEHVWFPWRFSQTPRFWWNDKNNQKFFLEEEILPALQRMYPDNESDRLSLFYNITVKILLDHGGLSLYNLYKKNVWNMLSSVFPHHTFYVWKFRFIHAPRGYWDDPNAQRQFIEWLARELNIPSPNALRTLNENDAQIAAERWYSLSSDVIEAKGGKSLMIYIVRGQ